METTEIRSNLPAQLSTFIGREREIADIRRSLTEAYAARQDVAGFSAPIPRLVTLAGVGGCGKTRLALQVATAVLSEYPDGVWLVELAALVDPGHVPKAVAIALGVSERPGELLEATLVEWLTTRRLLLVLDNCEHLISATAHLSETLLRSCPSLQILATSREPLHIPGELIWRVPPLSTPDPRQPTDLPALREYESVRLFEERARAASPAFDLKRQNAAVVAHLCHRLAGIPLALELAAARIPVLSVEQIGARLDDTFRLLTGGSRTALPRQQTLKATIDWSYALLSTEEQRMYRWLAVFVGGFTLEAAETVASHSPLTDAVGREGREGSGEEQRLSASPFPPPSTPSTESEAGEVLDLLSQLVDKSLVTAEADVDGALRYRLLEPIRQYAWERLLATAEAERARERHAAYFLTLAEQAEPALVGPNQGRWLARLEREHENLRAAVRWSRERRVVEQGLRFGGALARFWWLRGHFTEGRAQLEALLALPEAAPRTVWRAKALYALGVLTLRHADYHAGDQAVARAAFEEALAIYRERGDRARVAATLRELGRIGIEIGDWAMARPFLDESLQLERELGNRYGIALTLSSLGWLELFREAYATARPFLEESLAIFRELEDKLYVGICLFFLARVACDQADYPAARSHLREIIETLPISQYRWGAPFVLEGFARLAIAQGQPRRGLCLAGTASALREAIGASIGPAWQTDFDRQIARARMGLDQTVAETAFREGRTMTLNKALDYALRTEPQTTAVTGAHDPVHARALPLTPREREVAILIARGLTNRQIAAELVITEATAEVHVKHILSKLGFSSRAQVAAWAVQQGLTAVSLR